MRSRSELHHVSSIIRRAKRRQDDRFFAAIMERARQQLKDCPDRQHHPEGAKSSPPPGPLRDQ